MRSSLRSIVDVVLDTVIAVLAVGGALLALAGSWSGAVGVAVALILIVGQLIWTYLQREAGWTPLGRSVALRALAAGAVSICLARTNGSPAHAVGAGLAAGVLIGSIALEPFVARAVRYTVPLAVRLPDLPSRRTLPELGWPAVIASVLGSGAGLLVAALHGSAWWWLLIAVVAVLPVVVMALDSRAKIVFARGLRRLVPKAVAAYAPDFVIYTSRPDDASYQVMMWLPYLERAGLRFIIVTRNAVPAAALAKLTDAPVVEARGIGDLDALIVPSLKAAFYVNASSGNGALVRFQHLTHIYLGHGDSDKPPSYNPTHAMYDQIFAAGPAATRRYAAHGVTIPLEKFRVVGRPQVEAVQQVQRPIAEVAQPTVLYAPTWRGHVEETMLYSLPGGERIVSALLARGATVIFRPHPFSYEFPEDTATIAAIHALLAADAKATGREHRWGAAAETDLGILDCMNLSDAMVTDVSSVVSDYLFSGKPFAMIAVPAEPAAFVEEFPVARASYVVRGDLADLDAQLDLMLGPDPLAPTRAEIRKDYLGDFPAEGYASAFVDAVRAVSRKESDDIDDDRGEESDGEGDGDDDAEDGDSRVVRIGRAVGRYTRVGLPVALDLAGSALAVICLLTALAHGAPWLVTLIGVLALVASYASAPSNLTQPRRWWRMLTAGEVTRVVLVLALAVSAFQFAPFGWAYAVCCLVLAVAVVLERRIRAAWTGGLMVRYLPAALERIGQIVPRGLLPPLGSVLLVAGLVLTWLDGPPVLLLVPTVIFALIVVEVTVRALWRAGEVERAELRLRPALEAYAPEFAVYFASPIGANYQVGMWLPYFVRIGRPFIIVTRTPGMLRQIEELCEAAGVQVPLIYRRTLRSVEEVIVESMSTAFYVNNAARNSHFIERREITHVWLNHGDSEKPACFNPVHAIYDLIFSAGQAGIDRYARHGVDIPLEKFRIVGRPQVELIGPARAPISEISRPTVLYAPTWQGPFADSRVYSLPAGTTIVQALLDHGARVIFRAHPFNYRYPEARQMIADVGALLDADRAATGREHVWGPAAEQEMTIEDCFNASDAMVSDVSAVVSDYLHSGKPFAMVSVGRTPEQLVADAPAAQAAYVITDELDNLTQVCDDLLGADPLAGVREQTKIYYLGDFPDESYADGFLDAARRVIDEGHALRRRLPH